MIEFVCKNCGQHLSADNSDLGQVYQCPNCGGNVQVPNPVDALVKRHVIIRKSSMQQCPYCGESIPNAAIKCRYCGMFIPRKKHVHQSVSSEYGLSHEKQSVEKPSSVSTAVFLSFVRLALGMIFLWTNPQFRTWVAQMGANSSAFLILQCFIFLVSVLFILGLNAGMSWIRWCYLIFTPINLAFFVIGLLMMLPNLPPIWQISGTAIDFVIFVNLASESAGKWYRAVANGQSA